MKILAFGEILWDVFGEEKKIGGAPFNFAAHAARQGANAFLISAVGKDVLGEEALLECTHKGLSTKCIMQTDHQTGRCKVTLNEGMPVYDLSGDMAYDHILAPKEETDEADAFYFGTLAQRGDESRRTLYTLLGGKLYKEVFLDINIRQNYYSDEILEKSISHATILKISREEAGVFKIEGSLEDICKKLIEQYENLKLIIVTLDADGAFVYERDGKVTCSDKPSCKVVSTVGAGDSFSAAFLVNYLKGETIETCLRKAADLASYVCEHMEAVPD